MPNGRQRGGFNPDRMADLTRPVQVVPQIVDAPKESPARGFTEVKIIGVGGGGNNAVNRMVETGVQGVEFIAVNTDNQALQMSSAMRKIPIGGRSARGLGAGGDAQQGERAAEISRDALTSAITGADMVFLTAGMGGGTGTGAAPIIAEIARRERALTVAVVTLPFAFEGYQRRRAAEAGLTRLRENVDALIVIPNDRLLQMADRQMSLIEGFRLADDVLRHGVQGISDLVTMTGLINLDFADVKAVMHNAGTALMAVGEGRGEGRALVAARAAISSPLLDVSIEGARGVLLNVSGGPDLTLAEVTEAAETIQASVDPDASIYFGAVIHPRATDEIRVTVIATGLRDAVRGGQSPAGRARLGASDAYPRPEAPAAPVSREREQVSREREVDPRARESESRGRYASPEPSASPSPRYSASESAPRYSAPDAPSRHAPPESAPRYSAPDAPSRYSSESSPRYSASESAPRYSAPDSSPRYSGSDAPSRYPAQDSPSRYAAEPPAPAREPARDPAEYERRRPSPTEWERGCGRQDRPASPPPAAPPPTSQPGDDDWDVPAFLRRRPRR